MLARLDAACLDGVKLDLGSPSRTLECVLPWVETIRVLMQHCGLRAVVTGQRFGCALMPCDPMFAV
jgi:hypothetical protein